MNSITDILIGNLFLLIGVAITGIIVLTLYLTYLKLKDKSKDYKELLKLTFKGNKKIIQLSLVSLVLFIEIIIFFLPAIYKADSKFDYGFGRWDIPSEMERLVRGKIGYDIPDTMKVGNQYKTTVSISKSLNDSILFLNIDSSGFTTEEIKVSSKVKVSLIDPTLNKNFDIVPLSTEEQLVDVTSNTIWLWNITPLRMGKNELLLRATVKVISDLGETPKDIPVFEKIITVQASPIFAIGQFLGDNWQWIAGTMIIPLLIWRYNKRKKKRVTKTDQLI